MTTIRLLTSGQHLAAVQKVKLASGDVDSVFLDVSFDSSWDEFTARTAVFYTSHDDTVLEMLLIDNKCTVPHEVLEKEGTLFIGVRGVPTDGTAIKTTTLVKQKIVKGADTGAKTLLLSPDIYQQYIKATGDGINPIVEDEIAKWDKRVQQRENQLNAYLTEAKEFMSGTVIWENSNENIAMSSQKISKDLSGFVRFKILYKFDTNSTKYEVTEVTEKDVSFLFSCNTLKSSTIYTENYASRSVTFTDKDISFSTGYKINLGDQDSSRCIPCKIIAYKY